MDCQWGIVEIISPLRFVNPAFPANEVPPDDEKKKVDEVGPKDREIGDTESRACGECEINHLSTSIHAQRILAEYPALSRATAATV